MKEINFLPKDYSPDLPILDETIEDVETTRQKLFKTHYRKHLLIFTVIAACWYSVMLILYFNAAAANTELGEPFFYLVFVPIIPFVVIYNLAWSKVMTKFMQQFAAANGYQYHKEMELKGDFNKYFTLFAPKGFQIEALQIFTPDFMALMQDQWPNFSLEFIGSQICIYHKGQIATKIWLYKMYNLARHLLDALKPLLSRMQKDVLATSEYYKNEL